VVPHPLDRDTEQEGLQIRVTPKSPCRPRKRREHILHDVLGGSGIGEQAPGQDPHTPVPAIERRCESGEIAIAERLDELPLGEGRARSGGRSLGELRP
jgi:hypothetical protein